MKACRDRMTFDAANAVTPAVFYRPRDREPGAYIRLANGRAFIVVVALSDVKFKGDFK